MKKPISQRRQKKNLQVSSIKKSTSNVDKDILEVDNIFNNFDLDKVEIDQLKKEVVSLKMILQDINQVIKNNDIQLSSLIHKIELQNSNNSTLLTIMKNEILDKQSLIFTSFKNEINKTLNIFFGHNKKEKDLERTISFQLGKEIIDSSRNIQSMISLPKKLYKLRQETILRKKIGLYKKDIEIKPVIASVSTQNIKNNQFEVLKLENILLGHGHNSNFDGSLINCLGINNHDVISVEKKYNSLNLFGNKILKKPHYFKSNFYLNVGDVADFILDNNMVFMSKVILNGIEFEFVLSFFDENKNRISFNIVKPNIKLTINLPSNCMYIQIGIKLIHANGEANINNVFFEKNNIKKNNIKKMKKGISIIIPSYKGEKTILDTLNSIIFQKNIDLNLLEVICIINGEIDNTPKIIEKFKKTYNLNLKLLYSDKKGASAARNLGISHSTHEYLLFIDDDDMISDNYIADMFELADKDSLVLSYINDLDQFGNINYNTTINKQLLGAIDNPNIFNTSSAITMIASKLLVTEYVKDIKFNENLRSGEDVSFFTEYVQKFEPTIKIVKSQRCAYIRRLVDNSVSRQPLSFDFNVKQRLDVIKELEHIDSTQFDVTAFTLSKIKAQIGFILKYLEKYPEDINLVLDEIILRKIFNFPYDFFWGKLGKLEAEQLVFSYCHPPFVDTSATIVGKRINQFGLLSDVIANDMSSNRSIDPEMIFLNRHYIKNLSFLNTPTSFGGWDAIRKFVESSNELVKGQSYKQIYSRVLWPASNFAAAEFKLNNPKTKWIAEFSDPVILDIEGNKRISEINDEVWLKNIKTSLKGKFSYLKDEKNLYVWCELIAYLFADEIIFTCDNQRKLMLDSFKYKEISKLAYVKSVIIPHPQPSKALYNINKTDYLLNSNVVNIGYFGVFYKNRKLQELIDMLVTKTDEKLPVLIHLFTNNISEVVLELTNLNIIDYFVVNAYVGYFEFLNISKNMDVLIVNDAKVSKIFGLNPYLPSKLSDYQGSLKPIWAFVEDNSALSKSDCKNIQFKTYMHNNSGDDICDVIEFIKFKK